MTTRTDPWTRVAHLWPLLATTRFPGTKRPWRPGDLTPAQRAQREAADHAERRMAEVFLGASPAPLHLDVLDTLNDLHARLWTTASELGMRLSETSFRSSLDDPRRLLEWCRKTARSQPDGIPVDAAAWDMLHIIEHALGEIWDGQALTADCPWCHNLSIVAEPSWYVRILPGRMPAIVCESGICEPSEQDAGTWWRGKPAWPLWEWSWLAQRLEADGNRQVAVPS